MTDILIGRGDHAEVNLDPRFGNCRGVIGTISGQVVRAIDPQPRQHPLRSRQDGIQRGEH